MAALGLPENAKFDSESSPFAIYNICLLIIGSQTLLEQSSLDLPFLARKSEVYLAPGYAH
jgi:hypothetical protein